MNLVQTLQLDALTFVGPNVGEIVGVLEGIDDIEG